MKNFRKKLTLLLLFGIFAIILSGCEFTFLQTSEPIEISGYVMFENTPLENVQIVSDFYQYATTNSDGFYKFTTRSKNLVFYAKKTGYNFTPKTYDISFLQEAYNFEGTQAKALNGKLMLHQILVAPTSIVSIPGNNFDFQVGSGSALKLHSFDLNIAPSHKFLISTSKPTFLSKNSFTNILNNEIDFEYLIVGGKANLGLEFELRTFYKVSAYAEEVSTERPSVFKTNTSLDTGDLDENNNVKLSIPGINSHSGGFTYNLQFVFKYTEN